MPLYRFYSLNKRGHINGLADSVDCVDDADALEKAKLAAKGRAIEIWDLARRVGLVEAQQK